MHNYVLHFVKFTLKLVEVTMRFYIILKNFDFWRLLSDERYFISKEKLVYRNINVPIICIIIVELPTATAPYTLTK